MSGYNFGHHNPRRRQLWFMFSLSVVQAKSASVCRILSGRGMLFVPSTVSQSSRHCWASWVLSPSIGSLTELDAAALAMHFGSDTVVFTAGAGGKGTG